MEQFLKFSHSVQGGNHIRDGKVCQDASDCYDDGRMYIVAVADGHGSDNYPRTDQGSKFAVRVALEAIQEFVKAAHQDNIDVLAEQETRLHDLELSILRRWHDRVEQDLAKNPFLETGLEKVSEKYRNVYLTKENPRRKAKAYGTTLIAVCVTEDYWFSLQIGDGKCFALDRNGECTEPIPWDENCQANITTSICDSDAIDEFRFFCGKEFPLAVFIGSDGVDDSYAGDEELHDLYRTIFCVFAEKGYKIGMKEIEDFLPVMSRKGSGDDVSMAGLIRANVRPEIINLVRCQHQYEAIRLKDQKLCRELAIAKEKQDRLRNAPPEADTMERQRRFAAEVVALMDARQKAGEELAEAKQRLDAAKDSFRGIPAGELEVIPQKKEPPADGRRRKKKRPKRSGKHMNWSKRHKKRRR